MTNDQLNRRRSLPGVAQASQPEQALLSVVLVWLSIPLA
jgi:hypothetical protein